MSRFQKAARSNDYPQATPGGLDMRGIGGALARRKWSIILPTLLATAGAVAFVNYVSPKYSGEARLLLESRVNYLNRADKAERDQPAASFDSEGVQSQVQVVMSNDLAREAIKRLKLVGNPEFDPQASGSGFLSQLSALLGVSKDLTERSVEDRVLQSYYEKLVVYPVGKSRVVGVEFSSKNPVLAAEAANTIADLYLEATASAKKDLARSAGTWLSSNIDDLRKRVQTAEAKVEEFRSRNGLFTAGRDTTLPQQQLAEASTQLTQARTQQADAQAKAKALRDMIRAGRVFEITEVANNELVRRLIEQRATMRGQLALESRTLMDGHPRIKELNAQIADVESQIRNAAERTVRGIENDARVAGARVEQLQASLDDQKRRSSEVQENEVQLRALEREARTLREQLESYLAKYREAIARDTDNAEPADARVISRAVVPSKPSFPKKTPIIALVFFASLLLTIALAIVRELMATRPVDSEIPDTEIGSWDAAEDMTEPKQDVAVAQEPVHAAGAQPVAASAQNSPSTLAALVSMISEERNADGAVRLLVLGAERFEAGAHVHALAQTLSHEGETILLPLGESLAPETGEGVEAAGFLDLIAGEYSFAEVIHREQDSALHIMPRGTGDLNDIATLNQPAATALEAIAGSYATMIIEAPAKMDAASLSILAQSADVAVIVSQGEQVDEQASAMFHQMSALMKREPLIMLLDPQSSAQAIA